MKKVVIAIPYLTGKGGTETVIKNFAEALDVKNTDDNISWKLVSFGGTKYPEWLSGWNKKVYNFTQSRYIQLMAYAILIPFLIAHILKKKKTDFFIATNPIIWSIAFAERNVFSKKTKIGAWYHYSFKMKNVKEKYLKKTDFFWAISSGIKDELLSLGVSPDKIDVIYNPVNVDNVISVKRSGKQNHFIYIGRIDYDGQKNVSELIRALNDVKGEWHCDLYGSVDQETKDRLLRLANKHTQSQIEFKGFYKDVWSQIKEADVLILTSKFEGLPMTLIEAAARGISLISSNCPVGPEEIVNNQNGFIYNLMDQTKLVKIFTDIVDKEIKISSISNVRKSVEKFSYQEYFKRVYDSLCNN
ncbi:glycosyltransferase [Lactobacillus helveticus]|uniref:glycosyltransferase n=1 Tax=Lactobacillus helveticus TaxID=1587 RepID=UPI0001FF9734|nr:glycosyltransferase [Lactobacillus helveticus]ADX70916.1 Putative glycosyltransferase [Lactobacillus helveticus H10]NRN83405.1 Glycogen synthase [Lactobacillus helveticus]